MTVISKEKQKAGTSSYIMFFKNGVDFQNIVTSDPETSPANTPHFVVCFQNRDKMIVGPKEAPRPLHANRTSQKIQSAAMNPRIIAATTRKRTTPRLYTISFSGSDNCDPDPVILGYVDAYGNDVTCDDENPDFIGYPLEVGDYVMLDCAKKLKNCNLPDPDEYRDGS